MLFSVYYYYNANGLTSLDLAEEMEEKKYAEVVLYQVSDLYGVHFFPSWPSTVNGKLHTPSVGNTK